MLRLITRQGLQELLDGGRELVEEDGEPLQLVELQPDYFNVALTADRRVVKFFRIKSLLSVSLFYPYPVKFARNARRLRSLGILAPEIQDFIFCPAIRRYALVYPLLEGETLASCLGGQQPRDELFDSLAAFVAELHEKGVYFRALHLRNVLRAANGRLGLIDITDIRFHGKPLTLKQRQRNFTHLLRKAFQRSALEAYGLQRFIKRYLADTSLDAEGKEKLLQWVTRQPRNGIEPG